MISELTQIITNEEYEMACSRIDEIFQAQEGPEANELDRLVTLVDAYETEHFPIGGA
jgi:HTH-type transcriptional regulator/antitoxin HigA